MSSSVPDRNVPEHPGGDRDTDDEEDEEDAKPVQQKVTPMEDEEIVDQAQSEQSTTEEGVGPAATGDEEMICESVEEATELGKSDPTPDKV